MVIYGLYCVERLEMKDSDGARAIARRDTDEAYKRALGANSIGRQRIFSTGCGGLNLKLYLIAQPQLLQSTGNRATGTVARAHWT